MSDEAIKSALWDSIQCNKPEYGEHVHSRFDALPPGNTTLIQDLGYDERQLADVVFAAVDALGYSELPESFFNLLSEHHPRITIDHVLEYIRTLANRA